MDDPFDFTLDCTKAVSVYNGILSGGHDIESLLLPLLKAGTNISTAALQVQLSNSTFQRKLMSDASRECHDTVCSNLAFNGNADIAGIGVGSPWSFSNKCR